jgi:hypothetical protein
MVGRGGWGAQGRGAVRPGDLVNLDGIFAQAGCLTLGRACSEGCVSVRCCPLG